MAATHTYTLLDDARSQIRLLRLGHNPTAEPDHLPLQLQVFNRTKAPPYFAISYTWGEATSTREILIDGKALEVRQNCFYSLWQAQQRRPGSHVWIDSVCINQQDKVEKSHQVQMMGRTYASSAGVLACLGPHDEDSEFLLRMLGEVSALHRSNRDKQGVQSDESIRAEGVRWMAKQDADAPARLARAMSRLTEKPYFTRMWIVQELVLAPAVYILYGPDEVNFEAVENFDAYTGGEPYRKGGPHAYSWLVGGWNPFVQTLQYRKKWSNRGDVEDHWKLKKMISPVVSFQCTMNRDRIYALSALVQTPAGLWPIIPDYTISDFAVVVDTLRHFTSDDREETGMFSVRNLVFCTGIIHLDYKTVWAEIQSNVSKIDSSTWSWTNMKNPDPKQYVRESVTSSFQLRPWKNGNGQGLIAPVTVSDLDFDRYLNDVATSWRPPKEKLHSAFQEVYTSDADDGDSGICAAYVPASAQPGDYVVTFDQTSLVIRAHQQDACCYKIVGQAIILSNTKTPQARGPPGKKFNMWLDIEDAVLLYAERPVLKGSFEELAERYATPVTKAPFSSFALLVDDQDG